MDTKALSPAEVAAAWVNTGVTKANLPTGKTILLAMFAGIFIGFGGFAFLTANATIANDYIPASLAKLIGAALFPCGLMLVIYCGSELFTGNNLLTIACMDGKITFTQLLRNWGLVYLGNALGSYLLAWVVYKTGLATGIAASLASIATTKTGLTFTAALMRGILCNILVVLACWMQTASKDLIGKIFAVWFPIMLFVFMGFEHSIANMFILPLAQLTGAEVSILTTWTKNILPVTLGNIIGGAGIVSMAYWYVYVRKTDPDPYDPNNPPPKKRRSQK